MADKTTSNIYYSQETDAGGLIVGGVGSDNLNRATKFSFSLTNPNTPLEPSLILNKWDSLAVFWTGSEGSLYSKFAQFFRRSLNIYFLGTTAILPLPAPGSVLTNVFKSSTTSLRYSASRSVAVSDVRTLVAYRSTNINTNAKFIHCTRYIHYYIMAIFLITIVDQLVNYTRSGGQILVNLEGDAFAGL